MWFANLLKKSDDNQIPSFLLDMPITQTIEKDGTIEYRNSEGRLHRIDGPAVIKSDGTQEYRLDNLLHRFDGPAVIKPNGERIWYYFGNIMRIDGGPSYIDKDGNQYWYVGDVLSRMDGPAVVKSNGEIEWWLNGIQYPDNNKIARKVFFREIVKSIKEDYLPIQIIEKAIQFLRKNEKTNLLKDCVYEGYENV